MSRSKNMEIKHILIHSRPTRPMYSFIPVNVHNTPLFDYNKAKNSINSDIKSLKRQIRRARLLKVQAYIAYRLTK